MSAPVVLVADDDRSIRTVLGQALGRNGYEVRTTPSASTLWQWVEAGEGDLVITDVVMPEENGLDLLQRIRAFRPDLRVIVMSAQSTLVTAVKATQRGAFEYLPKPFDLTELLAVVERALEEPAFTFEEGGEPAPEERMPLLGRSVPMQDIYRIIARLTTSDLTVMITGESGTGKELVARALHDYGHRRTGPFVAVNLAAIPKDRIETELFGQESGGGRVSGRFEQAAGGTLFLDEVGDMPPEAQIRLLRVLQDGEFTVTGGRRAIRANVRIIAATQKDLRQAIAAGTFREDLFYRLDVVPIRVPPLRDRVEDIPLLARHFLDEAQEEGHTPKTLTQDALDQLQSWRWPGNVRELANLMQRIVALHPQESVTAALIEAELAGAQPETTGTSGPREEESFADVVARHIRRYLAMGDEHGDGLHTALHEHIIAEVERPLLRVVLEATRGNQIRAAAILGLNRNTLRKKIRELDIPLSKGP
ncbi:two component response regulator NtrC [Acetobacter estunensis NRIC 0472]|uniref:DNA-binding transcriptional regulator NtrC n=1 Tax=Acetobacter estunensis TaxID=104097 RepID=A0A967B3K5_9PROT|nr:nitrogen regulation protein NR(I) [Acetobacter estunensis]NHO53097.1 nitrogen regulation protein NR(I) [Acetobacter estunensis]GBQ24694.1 two component response regulator NtrC [Acetobacter estunensis NRIC 0472]